MERVVDIQTDGLFLAVHRGFLTVSSAGEEKGRIPLDDIGALIVHAHGTTWSNSLVVRLSDRAVPIVICGSNHAPVACVWPLHGHHAQGARMRAQIAVPKPLTKQIWRQIVSAKIRMQGHMLAANGHPAGAFDLLARKVRSGDPDNVEAQAARRYWKMLFGPDFSRDRSAEGANAMLNYGYTVLRAVVSRAICAAGLHPTIGVFHANRTNAFALSDDLMEPYRPFVDQLVLDLVVEGETSVDARVKHRLAGLTAVDIDNGDGTVSPLAVQVQRFVHSVADSFVSGRRDLALPVRPVARQPAAIEANA